jgi:uncharacterized protein
MEYKASFYNFFCEASDKKLLLFNARTGAFVGIPTELKTQILEIINGNNKYHNDYINNELIKGGFIVPLEFDEIAYIKNLHYRYKIDKNSMVLTLLPSESCNFRCPYCFIYKKRNISMHDWVYQAVLNYIEKSITENFKIKLNWFGGEPTLAHKKIVKFMHNLNLLATKHSLKYLTYAMVTNGYLLTNTKMEEYLNCGLDFFQITFDGYKETHDNTRFLGSKIGTFDTIWNNLISISKIKRTFQIAIRVNFLNKQDSNIEKLIESFHANFGSDKRFHLYFRPIYNFNTCRNDIMILKKDIFSLEEGVYKQIELNLRMAHKNKSIRKEYILSNPIPRPISSWCDTEKETFWVIGADGLLFKCDSYIGEKNEACGKILPDGSIEKFKSSEDWHKSIYELEDSKCFKCKILPICQGGCPRIRKENGNTCYLNEEMIFYALNEVHNFEKNLGNNFL